MKTVTYFDFNNPILQLEQEPFTNLGALYIMSALENKGYDVDYRDYQISEFARSLKIDNMVKFMENSTEVILICCMAYMLPLVILAIKKIKQEHPEKVVILGGVGPTGVAEELVTSFEYVDIIIKGEGEEAVVEVLQTLETKKIDLLKKVKGIVFRDKEGKVVVTEKRMRVKTLDEIVFPAYHKIDMKKYSKFGLITGRGCAYKCKFCDIHGIWGDKYFQRSMGNVFQELEILVKEYGVKKISIMDDTFTMGDERVLRFCNELEKRHLKLEWDCFGRVNRVNQKLLERMADSGCEGVFYGLESGSQRILDLIDKRITVETMVEAIEMTIPYMRTKGHFLWGFPFEKIDDLYKTVYLYEYLKDKMSVSIGQVWPYPTSPLYEQYKDIIKFNPDLDSFSQVLPFKDNEETDRKKVIELIGKHKNIFTQFSYYDTDNFADKYNMISTFKHLDLIM